MNKKRQFNNAKGLWKNVVSLIIAACFVLLPASATAQSRGKPLARDNWYGNYQNSNTVIVFVHGIFGDSNTFLYEDKANPAKDIFWPDLVAADMSMGKASIFMGGFYTSSTALDFGADYAAQDFFEALGYPDKELNRAVIDHQNIIFVTHSTGGIIVRRLLVKHADAFKGKHIGLLLIASPSIGSSWADRLSPIAKLANNQLAQELQEKNSFLAQLDLDFKSLLGSGKLSIEGREAFENKFVVNCLLCMDKVVDVESAARYFPDPIMLPNTSHFTTVKPDSDKHPAHQLLAKFFAKYFNALNVTYPVTPPNSALVRVQTAKADWIAVKAGDAPVPVHDARLMTPLQCPKVAPGKDPAPECVLKISLPAGHYPLQIGDYRLVKEKVVCNGNTTICSANIRNQYSTRLPEGSTVAVTVVVEFSIQADDVSAGTPVALELTADIEQLRANKSAEAETRLPYGDVIEVKRPQAGEKVSLDVQLLNTRLAINAGQDASESGVKLLPDGGNSDILRYQIGQR